MIYEILSIIPAKFSDNEIDAVSERIAKMLEAAGAKIEKTINLGKIKLAYAIDHVRFGTYVLVYIEADAQIVKKIDQDLRLADEVLRHMTVARPDGIPVHTPKPTSYVAPLTSEGRRASDKADDRPVRPHKAVAAVEGEKLSTQELDKKLDEILDSDIMKSI